MEFAHQDHLVSGWLVLAGTQGGEIHPAPRWACHSEVPAQAHGAVLPSTLSLHHSLWTPTHRGVVWAERKGNSLFNPQEVRVPFRHVMDLEVGSRKGEMKGRGKDRWALLA